MWGDQSHHIMTKALQINGIVHAVMISEKNNENKNTSQHDKCIPHIYNCTSHSEKKLHFIMTKAHHMMTKSHRKIIRCRDKTAQTFHNLGWNCSLTYSLIIKRMMDSFSSIINLCKIHPKNHIASFSKALFLRQIGSEIYTELQKFRISSNIQIQNCMTS